MIQKLLSTTAFRLSLVYALLFSLIAAMALGMAYWFAAQLVRQQIDERLQLETNVLLSQYYSGDFNDLSRMISHRNSEGAPQFFVYTLAHRQQHDFFEDIAVTTEPQQATFATLPLGVITTQALSEKRQKVNARILLTPLPPDYQLLVGTDMSEAEQLLEQIATVLLVAVLVIMLAALLGGWRMGQSVLRRVDGIHLTAKEIIEGDLSQRMPLQVSDDEFNRLAKVVNEMLDRLQTVMISMREVTDNLAHDLRNPLNRLHHRLEALRYLPHDSEKRPQELDQELESAVTDVSNLIATFNAILNIAQIESSVQHDRWEDIDITDMIQELGELYSVVAEEEGIAFQVYSEKRVVLHGDRQLIAQAITNVLDNAVKYTHADGKIKLEAYLQFSRIIIKVCDSGKGIPKADYKRVFERFTRLDMVRNTPGNGLGLSLVKAVVDLHQADITLSDNEPGLCVKLSFDDRLPNT